MSRRYQFGHISGLMYVVGVGGALVTEFIIILTGGDNVALYITTAMMLTTALAAVIIARVEGLSQKLDEEYNCSHND